MPRTLAILVALALLGASPALACRCAKQPSPATAFKRADAVVVADVVDVAGDPFGKGGAIARLRPSQSWKISMPAEVDVLTKSTCAYEMKAGETYLLYLARSGDESAPFATYACVGNAQIDEASPALKWLSTRAKSK